MGDKVLLIAELKARYKKWYDAVQPIPYIRDRLYCVDRIFVEGGITFMESSWDSHHLVFNAHSAKSNRRMILGEAGYGKSTLSLQYAYDWCNRVKESYLKDTEILILLRLRQLGRVSSIYKAIKRFLLLPHTALSETGIKDILEGSSSVVIILDGFDEYPDADSNDTDIKKIITSEMFEQFEVIFTGRYLPKQHSPKTKLLRLNGFNESAQDNYIQKAVVGDNVVASKDIKRRLKDNPVLWDLCHVPLFFAMFAHMSYETENVQPFNTVTGFFQCMIKCFHSHMDKKYDDSNVQKYFSFANDHEDLDKIAFESLSAEKQDITYQKRYLCENLGQDFYDHYVRIGILVEEDHFFDDSENDGTDGEVRFYHKLFCEWYAAHYLVRIAVRESTETLKARVRYMKPFDLQYCYMFACGLDRTAATRIIDYLNTIDGGKKFATFCILERLEDLQGIIEKVQNLSSGTIQFGRYDSRLIQRSTIQLLQIASKHDIPMSEVNLHNYYGSVDVKGDFLQLKSDLSIPVLGSLEKLSILEYGRELSEDEFVGILLYSLKCVNMKKLEFSHCMVPWSIQVKTILDFKPRYIEVRWRGDYLLNLESGLWMSEGREMAYEEYQSKVQEFRETYG